MRRCMVGEELKPKNQKNMLGKVKLVSVTEQL